MYEHIMGIFLPDKYFLSLLKSSDSLILNVVTSVITII